MSHLRFCLLITGTRREALSLAARRARHEIFKRTLGPIRDERVIHHLVVIHGAQRGIDRDAGLFMGAGVRVFKSYREIAIPYFDELGRRGGHERSRLLVDLYAAFRAHTYDGEIHAFPSGESPGTRGTIRYAEKLSFVPAVTELGAEE